jgi:hypothetical protein
VQTGPFGRVVDGPSQLGAGSTRGAPRQPCELDPRPPLAVGAASGLRDRSGHVDPPVRRYPVSMPVSSRSVATPGKAALQDQRHGPDSPRCARPPAGSTRRRPRRAHGLARGDPAPSAGSSPRRTGSTGDPTLTARRASRLAIHFQAAGDYASDSSRLLRSCNQSPVPGVASAGRFVRIETALLGGQDQVTPVLQSLRSAQTLPDSAREPPGGDWSPEIRDRLEQTARSAPRLPHRAGPQPQSADRTS